VEKKFPRYGKTGADFSTPWKIPALVFHAMENFFPHHGKRASGKEPGSACGPSLVIAISDFTYCNN
jgi:hypothetical protein